VPPEEVVLVRLTLMEPQILESPDPGLQVGKQL
jgi:hypothetical protein